MTLVVDAFLFGIAIALILLGVVGTIVPILPGTILIWLTILIYAILENFQAIDWISLSVLTFIALLTGTADLWLTILGSRKGGASALALIYGLIGGLIGFVGFGFLIPVLGNLLGGIIGYATGILLGQYQKHGDWNQALRASLGGVFGWGVASIVQLSGGLLMLAIFIWQVLSF